MTIGTLQDEHGRVWVREQTRSSRDFGFDAATSILTFGLIQAGKQSSSETGYVPVNGKEHFGRFIDNQSAQPPGAKSGHSS
jgi:hypothetical protein